MKDIVVTGMAVWDTLGHDLDSNFQKMVDTRTNSPTSSTVKNYLGFGLADSPEELFSFQEKYFAKPKNPKFFVSGTWIADQAIAQAGLITDKNRVGVVGTTLFADGESQVRTAKKFSDGTTRAGPGDLFFTTGDILVSALSRIHDIRGMTWSMAASCSAGIYAIEMSAAMIRQNLLDQAVIATIDFGAEPYNAYRTHGTNPYSSLNISRPFDKSRDGIVMGDGIAAIVLESGDSARSRGANILATVLGTGTASQCAHRTNPRQTQDAYVAAFEKALASASITADDIGWISAHATSTIDGDEIENEIMSRLLPGRPISTFKGHIGHTMGASGLVEIVYTIKSQQRGLIPGIANTQEVILPSTLDFVLENQCTDGRPVIKNSYGFGGRAASIILQV